MTDKTLVQKAVTAIRTLLTEIDAELIKPDTVIAQPPTPPQPPPTVVQPPPPPPPLSAMKIAMFGNASSQFWSNTQVGWITAPTKQREAVAPPLPWRLTSQRCDPATPPAIWVDNRYDQASLLYFSKPEICLKDGKPIQKQLSHHAGADPQPGIDAMNKLPLRGGQQGSACLSPYVTYRGHASGGTPEAPHGPLFFWAGGMHIGYLNADGTAQLVAGRIPVDPLALYDEDHPDAYWKWVGNFSSGKPIGMYDITGFRAAKQFFYCSDFTANCVWEVERPNTKDATTWIWRKISGLNKPMYIQDTFDVAAHTGRVFVVDVLGLNEIDRVTLTAKLILPMPDAMFVRATSKETLVVADQFGGFIEYDPVAKTSRQIRFGGGSQHIIIGDVSPAAPHDYFLPQDTILWSTGSGATPDGNNKGFFVMDLNGVMRNTPVFAHSFGNMPHGMGRSVVDMYGHYPWALSFHPELSLVACAGFAGGGVSLLRPAHADDKNAWQDGLGYYSGWQSPGAGVSDMMQGGTSNGWPFGVSPSLTATWGPRFESYLAPSANELVLMGKEKFTTYMRNGEFDGVPRPEFGELQIESLWWWANACSYPVVLAGTMPAYPTATDKVPPVVFGITVTRANSDALTISWKTEKPSFGFVNLGQSFGLYYRAKKEAGTAYGLEHRVTFDFCLPGRDVHFVVGAQSVAGFLSFSIPQLSQGV